MLIKEDDVKENVEVSNDDDDGRNLRRVSHINIKRRRTKKKHSTYR